MTSSTVTVALAALVAMTPFARAMAPVARETRNCLLLWLALRGTRPDQRLQVLEALPPLDQQPLPTLRRFAPGQPFGHLDLHPQGRPPTNGPQGAVRRQTEF